MQAISFNVVSCSLVSAMLACAGTALAQAPLTQTTAAQGDAATAPNVTFNIINIGDLANESNTPSVSGAGGSTVIFRSDLAGAGTTAASNVGLFAGPYTAPALLAREGLTAAGQPVGVNWSDFAFSRINSAGNVAFVATMVGAGITAANNEGIWRGPSAGPLSQVALRGGSGGIAGTPSAVFADLFGESLRLSNSGHVSFFATLTGAGVAAAADRGLWINSPAGVQSILAVENDQAPGVPLGVLYSDFTDPSSSDVSSLVLGSTTGAWISTLRGTGVVAGNDVGVFSRDLAGGTNSLVFREGDTAAPFVTGGVWGGATAVSVNDSGRVVVRTPLTGVAAATNVIIVAFDAGVPSVIARKGDAAPGIAGVTFSDLPSAASLAPKVDATGGVAFLATLAGTGVVTANNQALCYKPSGDAVQVILRKGSQYPGAPVGANVNAITSFSVNASGEMIIACTLTGTGVTTATDNALLAYIPGRGLRSMTREGDVVPVETGLSKTMNASSITVANNSGNARNNAGGSDGLRATLGGDGTLVYRAYFTDGSARLLAVNARQYPCTESDVAGSNQAVGYNGLLTADDIIVFLGWFFASDIRADVAGPNQSTTPDGNFTADDIIVFLGRYFAGC